MSYIDTPEFRAKRKEILKLRGLYDNYMYLSSIESIKAEKDRLSRIFNTK